MAFLPASLPLETEVASVLKRYETLLEVAGSTVSQVGLSDLFRDLLQRLKDVGKFDFLNLVLHDPNRKVMRMNVLQALIPVTIPKSHELPIGDSPAGWVWENQKPLLLRNLADESRFSTYIRMIREIGIAGSMGLFGVSKYYSVPICAVIVWPVSYTHLVRSHWC